jgi:hypothetical protein
MPSRWVCWKARFDIVYNLNWTTGRMDRPRIYRPTEKCEHKEVKDFCRNMIDIQGFDWAIRHLGPKSWQNKSITSSSYIRQYQQSLQPDDDHGNYGKQISELTRFLPGNVRNVRYVAMRNLVGYPGKKNWSLRLHRQLQQQQWWRVRSATGAPRARGLRAWRRNISAERWRHVGPKGFVVTDTRTIDSP